MAKPQPDPLAEADSAVPFRAVGSRRERISFPNAGQRVMDRNLRMPVQSRREKTST